MRPPRITIGRLMIVVALAGLGLAGVNARRRYVECMGRAEICAAIERGHISVSLGFQRLAKGFRKAADGYRAKAKDAKDHPIFLLPKRAGQFASQAEFADRVAAVFESNEADRLRAADSAKRFGIAYRKAAIRFWIRPPREMPESTSD